MKRSIFIVASTWMALLVSPRVSLSGQSSGTEVLFGIVHTRDKQPIPNVRVTISSPSGSSTVVSGSAGQFTFHRLAAGMYTVTVGDRAYRLKEPVRVLVSESTRLNLELTLKEEARPAAVRRGVLSGVLRTANGSPASGIVLTISGPAGSHEVVTTHAGEYFLRELLPGMYRIHIEEQGFALDDSDGIEINPGEETHLDLILTLHEIVQVVAFAPKATIGASTPGMSTRVVEADEIDAREASSFVAIMRDLPGVAVSRKGGVGGETFAYIRGGAQNYALVLLDGLPVNDPGGAFDFGKLLPLEIGRVEVTRGAASSIYGGALSGVVQLSTRQAGPDERKLFVTGEGGGFSWNRVQGGTSGRTDRLDWNLGFLHLQTDNQVPNNAFSQIGAAGSLGAQLSDDTSLRFIFRGESSEVGTPGPSSLIRPDLDASDKEGRVVMGATLRHQQGATEHILRGGFSRTNKLALNPEDSGPIDIEPPEGDAAQFRFVVPDFASPDGLTNNTERYNLGYQADVERGNHLFSVGGEVEKQKGEFGIDTSPAPTDTETPRQGFGNFLARFQQFAEANVPERTNVAGFIQDRIILGSSMLLTVGGRVERNGSFGTKALPRAAYAVSVGSATTLKASAGMGLKEPSLEQSFGGSFRIQGNPDLLPERSRTLDAGIRQDFFDGRFWTEGTVFYHQYQDPIVLSNIDVSELGNQFSGLADLTPEERQEIRRQIRAGELERFELQVDFDQFRPTYTNLGKTRGQGFELSFGGSPFRALRFRGDYTWLDTAVLEGNNQFIEGDPLPNRPHHQISVSARSELGRLTLGGTFLFVGERRAEADFISLALGLTTNEAYSRFDFRARVALTRGLEAYVVTENLFDRQYEEVLGYPALGRSVRVGVSWDWNMK